MGKLKRSYFLALRRWLPSIVSRAIIPRQDWARRLILAAFVAPIEPRRLRTRLGGTVLVEKELLLQLTMQSPTKRRNMNSSTAVHRPNGRPVDRRGLHVCVIGTLGGNLNTPPRWLDGIDIGENKVVVFDLADHGLWARRESRQTSILPFTTGQRKDALAVFDEMHRKEHFDICIYAMNSVDASRFVERSRATTDVYLCTGSIPALANRTLLNLWVQDQCDLRQTSDGLNSLYTGLLPGIHSRSFAPFYDSRGMGTLRVEASRERLIFVHGSLYKFRHPSYLTTISNVLRRVSDARFVFAGSGTQEHLNEITQHFRREGVNSRVDYAGHLPVGQGDAGQFSNLAELLGRAAAYANPWPVGGGSSRIEAYGMGTPVVHLGMDGSRLTRPSQTQTCVDVPALNVHELTAFSVKAYEQRLHSLLVDGSGKEKIDTQFKVFNELTSPENWWGRLTEIHQAVAIASSRT